MIVIFSLVNDDWIPFELFFLNFIFVWDSQSKRLLYKTCVWSLFNCDRILWILASCFNTNKIRAFITIVFLWRIDSYPLAILGWKFPECIFVCFWEVVNFAHRIIPLSKSGNSNKGKAGQKIDLEFQRIVCPVIVLVVINCWRILRNYSRRAFVEPYNVVLENVNLNLKSRPFFTEDTNQIKTFDWFAVWIFEKSLVKIDFHCFWNPTLSRKIITSSSRESFWRPKVNKEIHVSIETEGCCGD